MDFKLALPEKLKKKWISPFPVHQKKLNLTIGVRSRRTAVPWVQVWVFWVRTLCRIRMLGRFGRAASDFRPYDVKSDVTTLDCNSRSRGDVKFLSSESEFKQKLGSTGSFVDLSEFRVPRYVRFRTSGGNLRSKPVKLIGLCSVSSRNCETDP